jgi:hypothetical protein
VAGSWGVTLDFMAVFATLVTIPAGRP